MKKAAFCMLAFAALLSNGLAAEFRVMEKITDSAYPYRLSRNSNGIMAFDSDGFLHATYWAGGLDTRPENPSRVFHRAWAAQNGWGTQETIDDSFVDGIGRVGGRHPTLAVTPDDTVWIAWSDHRHCTEAGNWMNNTEIYADFAPSGGSFSGSDLRLTQTTSGTMGDNGYAPKLACDMSGNLHLAWHDYGFDPTLSDIYLTPSGLGNLLSIPFSFFSMRATDTSGQGGPEYTIVDMAVDQTGTRHLVWCGGQAAGVDLYYGAAADGVNALNEQVIASGATDFFDPPHVAVSPAGDVWVAWGDESTGVEEDVKLLRKRSGQSAFDAPISIAPKSARQYGPTIAIDSNNQVHLAWIDESAGRHIRYAVFDPDTETLLAPTQLTTVSANWSRPSMILDAQNEVYILAEVTSGPIGEIWFTTTVAPPAEARNWRQYR